jgi:hypothetical protein
LSLAMGMSLLAGCTDGTVVHDGGDCPPLPVLAAGDETVALSCAAGVRFRGRKYWIGCAEVHPSRVGAPVVRDGGESGYEGARRVKGVSLDQAFIVMGDAECGRARVSLATTRAYGDNEDFVLDLPLGSKKP